MLANLMSVITYASITVCYAEIAKIVSVNRVIFTIYSIRNVLYPDRYNGKMSTESVAAEDK